MLYVKFGELIFEEIKTHFFHLRHWACFPVFHRPTLSVKKACWYPKVCVQVIVKERHETIMGYKPRERVALEWFIPIIIELLVL